MPEIATAGRHSGRLAIGSIRAIDASFDKGRGTLA